MSQSEENEFENEWRSAFDDAAEPPSDRVWEAIERRLDEEEGNRILPLWKTAQPWIYGAVAAIALLVIGWWALRTPQATDVSQPVAEQATQPTNSAFAKVDLKSTSPLRSSVSTDQPNAVPTASGNLAHSQASSTPKTSVLGTDLLVTRENTTAKRFSSSPAGSLRGNNAVNPSKQVQPELVLSKTIPSVRTNGMAYNHLSNHSRRRPIRSRAIPSLETQQQERETVAFNVPSVSNPSMTLEVSGAMLEERLVYEAFPLKGKSIRNRQTVQPNRIVWYHAPETIQSLIDHRHEKREYWAALSATPMSFNSGASLVGEPVYSAVTQGSIDPASSLQNQANFSMAYQVGGGMHLSKHWSVEAGVQYLQGRSDVRNSASAINAFTSQSENLLLNTLRNSSPSTSESLDYIYSQNRKDIIAPSLVNTALNQVVPMSETISNDFRYLQIPLQAGYHIRPTYQVSYVVLGGFLANVFLQNSVGPLEIKPSDGIYRQLLLAGTVGLRINYRPANHWSGSLTGSYQRALQSGTRSETQLTIRPVAMGIGFGLNYHF